MGRGAATTVLSTGSGSVNFSSADGLFLAGTTLYWASRTTGALHAVPFNNGSPSSANDHVVSGTPVDSTDWHSQGMFLLP